MNERAAIGFDRKLEREWLDLAAQLAATETPTREARARLFAHLEGVVAGSTLNSGRGKTLTVLMRLWITPPAGAKALRDRAAAAFRDASEAERLALHWAMAIGTYPFFASVAEAVGRLLRLQEDVALAQVDRRLAEAWGERSTLHRSVQRICRSMVDWGVLNESSVRGTYRPAARRSLDGPIGLILAEAVLTSGPTASLPVAELGAHPALFPFQLGVSTRMLRTSNVFGVERGGLDTDYVSLGTRGR
jgi:hypothetical protein